MESEHPPNLHNRRLFTINCSKTIIKIRHSEKTMGYLISQNCFKLKLAAEFKGETYKPLLGMEGNRTVYMYSITLCLAIIVINLENIFIRETLACTLKEFIRRTFLLIETEFTLGELFFRS